MYAVLTQHRVNVARALKPQTKTNMLLSVPEDVKDGSAFPVEPSPIATRFGLLASRSVSIVSQGQTAVQLLNVTSRVFRVTDHDGVDTLTSDFELLPQESDTTAAVFAALTGTVKSVPPHTCVHRKVTVSRKARNHGLSTATMCCKTYMRTPPV